MELWLTTPGLVLPPLSLLISLFCAYMTFGFCDLTALVLPCKHATETLPCPRWPSYPFTVKHCLPPFTHVDSWLEATVIAFSMRATQLPRVTLGITRAKHLVPDLTQYPDAVWVPIEHYSYSGNILLRATLSVILTIHMPVVCTHISTY